MKNIKKLLSIVMTLAMLLGVLFVPNSEVIINADAATSVVWTGAKAAGYSGGNGTKEKPYIIKTPMQLYKAVSETSTFNDGTPKHFRVADGVETLVLSDYGNKTYSEIKAAGDALSTSATTAEKNWIIEEPEAFEGVLDGNGVVITGMISKSASGIVGLIPYLGKGAVVKNIVFDGCYAKTGGGYAGLLSSEITASNRSGYTLIDSVAVINSYIKGTSGTGGIFASSTIPDTLAFSNCLFDGQTCNSDVSEGIYGSVAWANRFQLYNCVSIGAKLAPKLTANSSNGVKYNNYNDVTVPPLGAGVSDVHPIYISNCYSDTPIEYTLNEIDADRLKEVGYTVDFSTLTTAEALMNELSLLDWQNGWYVAERDDGTLYPMIRHNATDDVLGTENEGKPVFDYNKLLGTQNSTAGANSDGTYAKGTYGYFYNFTGSGTESDPYIITNALELARAIGCGGKNINQKLYFKLACDIDLQGFKWLNAVGYRVSADSDSDGTNDTLVYDYKYVPFEGTLDGDGHTITGLYAIAANGTEAIFNTDYNYGAEMDYLDYAGLIPVLNGGSVKNLHIRDSYVGGGASSTACVGAIAGTIKNGGEIAGCSVEDTTVVAKNTNYITGTQSSPKNSYFAVDDNSGYFDADGNQIANLANIDYSTGVWYKGGYEGATPKLVNHAKTMPYTDVDGDGDSYESNTSADLVALRNKILGKSDYADIYGDVNNDGVVNIGDLVVLRREIAGDYNQIDDGFWRNVEIGNVEIFYGENDNYDAARKIELYFENLYSSNDLQKYISSASTVYKHSNDGVKTPDGQLDVIVGYIADTDYASDNDIGANQYRIKYDDQNKVLWLQGDNFTAVEQAVLDFIAAVNSNGTECEPTTSVIDTLSAEKQPVTVDGQTYYYAWGDEFDGINQDRTGVDWGTWRSREAHSERSKGTNSTYRHQEYASIGTFDKMFNVSNGKLTINRGYRIGATYGGQTITTDTAGYDGYVGLTDEEIGTTNGFGAIESTDKYFNSGVLVTSDSMLFKKGYVEFMVSLPADGHAFPALWLYGGGIATSFRNRGWENSLYSKIYTVNEDWNGVDLITWSTPESKKYNVPENFYELDVIELMQAYYRLSSSQQNQDRYIDYYSVDTTIHKWTWGDSENTSVSLSNVSYDFGSPTTAYSSAYGFTKYIYASKYASNLADVQAMRKYGFLWDTTDSGTTLKTYIYNTDGSLLTTLVASLSGTTVNDYLQILIDNEFYSSNTTAEYSGMLTTVSGKDAKAKLEVDYVRLYQLDGKRDIVTVETEAFNTGNHFGY